MSLEGYAVQIKSDRFVEAVRVYGARYALCVAQRLNEHFAIVDEMKLKGIEDNAFNFEFPKSHR
jgi:hypothetical protein